MPEQNNVVIASENLDHSEPKKKQSIKQLAYGGAWGSGTGNPGLYRNDRGLPFFRAGKPVTVVPQFKGLTIYSPINTNLPGNSFRNTITGTAVTYPAVPK